MQFLKIYNPPFNFDLIKEDCLGKSGIYLILNLINKDFYIGCAISKTEKHNRLYFRFREHFIKKNITNKHLKNAIVKYGKNNFSFNILEFCDMKNVIKTELLYIEKYQPKYNILKLTIKDWEAYENYHIDWRNKQIGFLNLNKTLKLETKNLLSNKAKLNHKLKKYALVNYSTTRNKETCVYDLNNNLLNTFISAKAAAKHYDIDYRTIRRHLKSGKRINKRQIVVKYNL